MSVDGVGVEADYYEYQFGGNRWKAWCGIKKQNSFEG